MREEEKTFSSHHHDVGEEINVDNRSELIHFFFNQHNFMDIKSLHKKHLGVFNGFSCIISMNIIRFMLEMLFPLILSKTIL